MAFAVVVSRMGGPSLLPAIGVRAAFLHGNSPCNEKWDNKWKSNSYGHMDANSCRKRHRIYVKRQKRAAEKRTLLEWRSLEMHADDYREVQERRKQQGEASSPSPHASKFGWSRRFEKEWQFFQKKHKGRQGEKHQEAKSKFYEQDPEESTSGHTKEQSSHDYWNSEAGRFKQQFWNQTWWAFGGSGDAYWKAKATKCNQSAQSGSFGGAHWQSGETSGRCSADSGWVSESVGAASDRVALGLSPVGPLTLNDVKLAFRQCALRWHPDRHHGEQKSLAEKNFKRIGDAYQTLRELL
ncbi:hypothetical protein BDL97_02G084200 [Sphagnum fallax]|nr:hypothetical protein BDL97_02G084200 [Sphagnum fallax]